MNTRKDEKIQLYRKVKRKQTGSTRDNYYRSFIYPQAKYTSGGLYANARDLKNSEIVTSGLQQEQKYIKFYVNRNPDVKEDLKVIYRGEIYDITPPIDNFDGRTKDITFLAIRTVDTTNYTGDLFTDTVEQTNTPAQTTEQTTGETTEQTTEPATENTENIENG